MMSEYPKISIVTPSSNQGQFIAEAIQSVLDQGHQNVEHIIVDNCSNDETLKVLARYPHLKVICEKDRGQSDALNKGFKIAKGDIIGWLNADDLYLPGCFDHMLKAFSTHPSYDLVYGDYCFVDVQGRLIQIRKELDFDLFMLKYLHVLYIPTTTTFFNRKIFDEGNFLNIDYQYAMDYEFFVRIAQRGYKFGHIPQLMANFRWHKDAKSSRQAANQKDEMEKALLEQDEFLAKLPLTERNFMRNLLMYLSRFKRYVLKALRGAY